MGAAWEAEPAPARLLSQILFSMVPGHRSCKQERSAPTMQHPVLSSPLPPPLLLLLLIPLLLTASTAADPSPTIAAATASLHAGQDHLAAIGGDVLDASACSEDPAAALDVYLGLGAADRIADFVTFCDSHGVDVRPVAEASVAKARGKLSAVLGGLSAASSASASASSSVSASASASASSASASSDGTGAEATPTHMTSISPAFQWAQSVDTIFIGVKFAHKLDTPATLGVEVESFDVTDSTMTLVASSKTKGKRFTLELPLFDHVVPDSSTWKMNSVGRCVRGESVKGGCQGKAPREGATGRLGRSRAV